MRKRLVITGGVLFTIFLICISYLCFNKDVCKLAINWLTAETYAGGDYFLREIRSNIDLWLNGYLGLFFRFKMFGNLNWLALPLFIYFLINIRKRERWEIALGLALCTSSIFLCIQGYRNYRYQLTLYPIFLTIIILFGWNVLKRERRKTVTCVIIICSCLILLNSYSLRKEYKYYFRKAIGSGVPGEGFPYKLIDYIKDNVENDSIIWEMNQPILYYYTNKKGISHYNKKAKYVLIRGNIRKQFKDVSFELMAEDQGYKLYKIRNKSNYPSIDDFDKIIPDFEINFSNRIGGNKVSDTEFDKILFPMRIQGATGDFSAQKISSNSGSGVRIKLIKPLFNQRPDLQFGYCIQSDRMNVKVESGNILSIVAKARVKENKSGQLFIQDFTDYWSRESIYLVQNKWNDVLVRKRIREGATAICFGINWLPGSTDEWLDLKLLRIFIEN